MQCNGTGRAPFILRFLQWHARYTHKMTVMYTENAMIPNNNILWGLYCPLKEYLMLNKGTCEKENTRLIIYSKECQRDLSDTNRVGRKDRADHEKHPAYTFGSWFLRMI